jgi:hypothetical protein
MACGIVAGPDRISALRIVTLMCLFAPLGAGPPIIPADPATERERLITANQAFAAALKQALLSGAETSAGVLATVSPKRGKNGILAL